MLWHKPLSCHCVHISSVSGGGTEGAPLRVTAASLCLTPCAPTGSARPSAPSPQRPSWQIESSHQGAEHLNFAGEMHSCDTRFWMGPQPVLPRWSHQSRWPERVLSAHITHIAGVTQVCRSHHTLSPLSRSLSYFLLLGGSCERSPPPPLLLSLFKLEPYKTLSLRKQLRRFLANLGSKVLCSLLMLLFFLQQHRMGREMCLPF